MDRSSELTSFYGLLRDLEKKTGDARKLGECKSADLPKRGVYFFFEDGEFRSGSSSEPRVVRVGTHALKEESKTSVWNRLCQHRGNQAKLSGNHRGSIFRRLVGDSMMERDLELKVKTWGVGASADRGVRQSEQSLEALVSAHIGNMVVLVLPVPDELGPNSERGFIKRGFIERNAIALLSGFKEISPDQPSQAWLGKHCCHGKVFGSGLWNNNHVDETSDPAFLDQFSNLLRDAGR